VWTFRLEVRIDGGEVPEAMWNSVFEELQRSGIVVDMVLESEGEVLLDATGALPGLWQPGRLGSTRYFRHFAHGLDSLSLERPVQVRVDVRVDNPTEALRAMRCELLPALVGGRISKSGSSE